MDRLRASSEVAEKVKGKGHGRVLSAELDETESIEKDSKIT